MAADGGKLKGAKGGSSSQRTPVEAPDSLNSTARATILDLLGEGEMAGWYSANPLMDVFLDETPVMNADGTYNFVDVLLDWREGTQTQSHMTGFPAVENEIAVGTQLMYGTPWVKNITNIDLDAVRIRLSVPALSKTDASTGDTTGYSVSYAIDVAADGGAYVTVLTNAFSGKCTEKYERSHRVDLPPATSSWNIRVRRTTPDAPSVYLNDTTFVESYTEVLDLRMRYPNSAYVGIKIDAGQFRAIPTRAYRRLGRIMQIPTNYNPVTRVYTGVWDGTFKLGWTNNPAWIFYDLVQNARFGLGKHVNASEIDKWSLYKIGQYCDELVPNGKGGTEPRFTCTIYLQRQEDAYKVIQDLASVFRGISYWGGGAIVPVCDKPRDPVYTYTNANVKEGKFTYQGSSRRARHTVALVAWSDYEDFNRQKVEYIEDEEGIARYGIQETQITAVGCTSQGQAQRVGRWILLTEQYETDTVSFMVGLDGTIAMPGQIINIVDAKRAGRRMGGRIKSATSTTAVLDVFPSVPPVNGDTLICISKAGVAMKRTVSGVNAGTKTITVSSAWDTVPVPESVWALETATLKTFLANVLSVSEGEGLTAVITALQHEPGKFAAVDNGTKIEARPTIAIADPAQRPPTSLTIKINERATDGLAEIVVSAKWNKVAGAVNYDVSWRRENGEWSSPQRVLGTSAELFNAFSGYYVCKVTARSGLNVTSVPIVSKSFLVPDLTKRPGYVSEMNIAIDEALQTAENAQATADGAIVAFWQDSPPVIYTGSGSPPAGQASEGDVWYDTNDGNHAWRAHSGVWVDAQDDDVAQAMAAASNAQATADGKVKMYVGTTAPPQVAPPNDIKLNDLWFNQTVGVKKLFRWDGVAWAENVGDVTLDQLGGTGINILWQEYAVYNDSTLPAFYNASGAPLTISYDPTVSVDPTVGKGSLKLIVNDPAGTISSSWVYFGVNTSNPNILIEPGKKYIVSAMIRHNLAAAGVQIGCSLRIGASIYNAVNTDIGASGAFRKITFLVDATTNISEQSALLLLYFNRAGKTVPYTVWIDRIMVEEQLGRLMVASNFAHGTPYNMVIANRAAAANAQMVADAAAADAASALNDLDDMAADGKLTATEIKKAKEEYIALTGEEAGIIAEAARYDVSSTSYVAEMDALQAYLNTLGLVGAGPSYPWIGGNTTITITRTTWNTNWSDVYINRQTVLNSIAAKVGDQLQNGIFVPPTYGTEMVVNGGFESTDSTSDPLVGKYLLNTPICDGWVCGTVNPSTPGRFVARLDNTAAYVRNGQYSLLLSCVNGQTIPAGASAYVIAQMKQPITSIKPGDEFLLEHSIMESWTGALPTGAGTQDRIFFGLRCVNEAGSITGDVGRMYQGVGGARSGAGTNIQSDPLCRDFTIATVPAGTVKAYIIAYCYLLNGSGATYTITSNPLFARFDDLSVKKIEEKGVSPNLLLNSEFAMANTGWGGVTAANVVKSQDGNRAQRTNDAANWFPYQDNPSNMTVAGEPYSASVEIAWSNLTNPSQHGLQLAIQTFNASTLVTQKVSGYWYPGTAYGTRRFTVNGFELPGSGYTSIRFVLSFVPNGNSGGFYHFRKPKLERSLFATPYSPGADGFYGTELTNAGSGRQIGDLRNTPPVGFANFGSAWSGGTLSYTATGTPAAATISFGASTLKLGGVDIAYSAATVGVTGANGSTTQHFLYFDDPTYTGGAKTLVATTSSGNVVNGPGRIYVGSINVTIPSAGGSGGGSGTKPCPTEDAFTGDGRKFREINAGDYVPACDPVSLREYDATVYGAESELVECVELICENGVVVPCSIYAQIPTDQGITLSTECLGRTMLTKVHGKIAESKIIDIEEIGFRMVRHVTAEQAGKRARTGSFWVGKVKGMLGLHHNIKYEVP